MYDVILIGSGVSGCAIARELAKKDLRVAVLDKASDLCEGTSKANSGIAHAGYDVTPGSLKARLNIAGSRKMKSLSKELDFPYKQNGSMVLCFDETDIPRLEELKARGEQNGVEGILILNKDEVLDREPSVGEAVKAALYAPSGAIICPFGLNIALAENAAANGVTFHFNTEVTDINKEKDGYHIVTNQGGYETRLVINAAGVYADTIHNMVCNHKIKIIPRKGEYLLFDKKVGNIVSHTLFQLPTALGKGVLVTPTVHGNLLAGPTAQDIEDKEGVNTTVEGIEQILSKAALSVSGLPSRQVITSFAGLRAHGTGEDFLIEESAEAPGFIDVAGMESPGLTCAPAVGEYVAQLVQNILRPADKKDFQAVRKGIPNMAEAGDEMRHQLIQQDPAYANVICRCEMITEGEILEAIHRPLGATTVDGIKRRTRAGMGRCQSGFCAPRTVELLARELGVDASCVTKAQDGSWYLLNQQ